MNTHRRIAIILASFVLCVAPRADAFCAGDPGWSGFIANIAPLEPGVVVVSARIEIDHLFNHPGCYGEIFAKALVLGIGGSCSDTATEPHYPTDPDGDFARGIQICLVPCGFFQYAGGEFSWNGNEHQEFDQSDESVRFPCDCEPPPGGCGMEGCVWDEYECECVDCCPLVLDTTGRGYKLTSADGGVWFDINADGQSDAISWTDPTGDVAFLAFDRNGNGTVDNGEELFGNVMPLSPGGTQRATNGFEALASLESEAYGVSARDGTIDARDAAYHKLLLWKDENHDGVSQASELRKASTAGLVAIQTKHRESKRRDQFGNEFRLRGISWWQTKGRLSARLFYDVWFVPKR